MAASKKDVAKQQVKEDREKVREMYLSGKTVKEIAKETYFSSSYCYAMVRDLAKEKNLAKKAKRAPLDEAMIQDAKAGMKGARRFLRIMRQERPQKTSVRNTVFQNPLFTRTCAKLEKPVRNTITRR